MSLKRARLSACLSLAWLFASGVSSAASPFDIDTSFGSNGVSTVPAWQTGFLAAHRIATDGDSNVYLVSSDYSGHEYITKRLASNGQLDPGFGDNGILKISVQPSFGTIDHLCVDNASHDVVLLGYVDSGSGKVAQTVRLTSTGNPVATWGDNGVSNIDTPGNGSFPNSCAFRSDGTALLIGADSFPATNSTSGRQRGFVAQLNAQGRLDTTQAAPLVTVEIPESVVHHNIAFTTITLATDGSFFIGGTANNTDYNDSDIALMKFSADNTVDTSFNGGSLQIVDLGGDEDRVAGILANPDGSITGVGASLFHNPDIDVVIGHFRANGSLDGDDQKEKFITLPEGAVAEAVGLDATGRILVSGRYSDHDSGLDYENVTRLRGIKSSTSGDSDDGNNGGGLSIQTVLVLLMLSLLKIAPRRIGFHL